MHKSALIVTKIALVLFGILAVTYLGIGVLLKVWQTRLIFFPSSVIKATPADANLAYEEVWLPVAKQQIHGWWIPAAKPLAPVLLYLHGNGSNLGDLVGQGLRFHNLGLSVLIIDYRGYGLSKGSFPNEASVYEDAEATWNYLRKTRQIAPQDILLYGHSLGGAIAIDLAVRHPEVAGVIVEGSFTSMRAMVDYVGQYNIFPVDWILTQRFDSLAKVRSLRSPILFIHGIFDETVPVQMSRELFAAASEPKQLLLLEAGHNNIAKLGGTKYLQAIHNFVQQVRNFED